MACAWRLAPALGESSRPSCGGASGRSGLGIVVGGVLVGLVFTGLFESVPTPAEAAFMAAYAALMLGVCLIACIGPTRRALRLEPSDVLRSDG